jgi:predicted RNase H-like HicB family nuclease
LKNAQASCGADIPDFPGCVAVAETEAELKQLIEAAIEIHLEDLRQSSASIPTPLSKSEYVEVLAA